MNTKHSDSHESTDEVAMETSSADDSPAAADADQLAREIERLKNENLRLIAEARNAQQRSQREFSERIRYAEADFARDLLTILDDLQRTIEAGEKDGDAASLLEGTRIIYDSFLKFLEKRQILTIQAVGQEFDPEVHEALLHQPSDAYAAGVVSQEIARGYKLHDRVIRPARVVVSSGPSTAESQ